MSHPTLSQDLEAFKDTHEYELALQVDNWAKNSYPRCCKRPGEFDSDNPAGYGCWYTLSSMSVMRLMIGFDHSSMQIEIRDGVASHFFIDIMNSAHNKDEFVLLLIEDFGQAVNLHQGSLGECLDTAFKQLQLLPDKFYSKQFLSEQLRPY